MVGFTDMHGTYPHLLNDGKFVDLEIAWFLDDGFDPDSQPPGWSDTVEAQFVLPHHLADDHDSCDEEDFYLTKDDIAIAEYQIKIGNTDCPLVQEYLSHRQPKSEEQPATAPETEIDEEPSARAVGGHRYLYRLNWDEEEWRNCFRREHSEFRGTGIQRDPKWKQLAGGGRRGRETIRRLPPEAFTSPDFLSLSTER